MVERSDRMWSTGEGNGKPLQYSCLENPMLVPQSCPTLCNPWTAIQAPLSMEFSRQGYWSGLPFPSPGDLPNPGIEPGSSALQAYSLLTELPGKPMNSMRRPQVGRCQYATGDQWMSKILQVSFHSYSGCDVTSVVYVMSYTVGSVFRNIVDVMSWVQSFDVSKSGCDIT